MWRGGAAKKKKPIVAHVSPYVSDANLLAALSRPASGGGGVRDSSTPLQRVVDEAQAHFLIKKKSQCPSILPVCSHYIAGLLRTKP